MPGYDPKNALDRRALGDCILDPDFDAALFNIAYYVENDQ